MITVSQEDHRPAYEQVREQLADQILSGRLLPGHRLPSVRQMAGDLGIAGGTVVRAYKELESDGLVEATRTGFRVRQIQQIADATRSAAKKYVDSLIPSGVSLEEAMRAVRVEWAGKQNK